MARSDWRRAWVSVCMSVTVAAASTPALAGEQPHTVALWFLKKGKMPAATLAAIDRAVEALDAEVAGLKVFRGTVLKKRLDRRPNVALAKCGPKLDCIGGLGKRAGADEVLIFRATSSPTETGTEVRLQYLVVGSTSQSFERKGLLTFADPDGVEPLMRKHFAEVFGVSLTPEEPVASSTDAADRPPPAEPSAEAPAEAQSSQAGGNISEMSEQVALLEAVLADAESRVREMELRFQPPDSDGSADAEPTGSSTSADLEGAPEPPSPAASRRCRIPCDTTAISLARLATGTVGAAVLVAGLASRSGAKTSEARRRADVTLGIGTGLLTSVIVLAGVDWLWAADSPRIAVAPTGAADAGATTGWLSGGLVVGVRGRLD